MNSIWQLITAMMSNQCNIGLPPHHNFPITWTMELRVDIGILDFCKAFGKVAHSRLVQKLEYYRIRGKPLVWIKSFLANRSQQVAVEGSYSIPCKVTSGVPQGSVLGLTLFFIYINDMVTHIQSTVWLFADNYLIYRPVFIPANHQKLQECLQKLSAWADKWETTHWICMWQSNETNWILKS